MAEPEVAEPEVAEPPCTGTKSMGNSDFGGLLVFKSSHLCNHWETDMGLVLLFS